MSLDLTSIRKHLHTLPEASGKEKRTADFLKKEVSKFSPSRIITDLGHYSFAVVFNEKGARTILIRADMDALPITEANLFDHRSQFDGFSHKCGHDGHSTILLGLAEQLSKQQLQLRVILLFQSAEETGEGARSIIESHKLDNLNIEATYALHNIPGVTKGEILCKKGVFCPASTGVKIKLVGKESHASQPQNGTSSVPGIHRIFEQIDLLNSKNTFATITHLRMGEKTFGISPAKAQIWCTLRSFEENGIDDYLSKLKILLSEIDDSNLNSHLSFSETFEACINSERSYKLIERAAEDLNLKFSEMANPNPWSEDFGLFTKSFDGAMFGIGSGKECRPLHDPSYDFPDDIISPAIEMFLKLIELESAKKSPDKSRLKFIPQNLLLSF